jgi:hypothetical protein
MEVICPMVQQIFGKYFFTRDWTNATISDYRKVICPSGGGIPETVIDAPERAMAVIRDFIQH